MPIYEDKVAFLRYEISILSLKAALSTRTDGSPIYSPACKVHQRANFKRALRDELKSLEAAYVNGRISSAAHCDYIASLADRISQSYGDILHEGRFRYGIAQKLVNLHLKYLWSLGLVEEPPHCPLDGIVRDMANLHYDWTTNNARNDYEKAINALEVLAQPRSLSVWELQEFRRRDQD